MKRHATLLRRRFHCFRRRTDKRLYAAPALRARRLPMRPRPAPQATSAAASATGAQPEPLFTVNDEKGLVLTCIAPEIDTTPTPDRSRAAVWLRADPGRCDAHFVQGIHFEQSGHQRERDEWQSDRREDSPKPQETVREFKNTNRPCCSWLVRGYQGTVSESSVVGQSEILYFDPTSKQLPRSNDRLAHLAPELRRNRC